MKTLALAVGTLLAVAATSVFAQDDADNYPYNARQVQRQQAFEARRDSWNDYRWREDAQRDFRADRREFREDRRDYRDERYRDNRVWRETNRECWNPRARHYEGVREGERQDDLDFSRCRAAR